MLDCAVALAPRLRQIRRAAGAGLILAGIILAPLPASGGALWDAAAIAGYMAVALTVVLFIYPLRRPGLPHIRLSSIGHHRQLGWAALGFAALHVVLLLASQPLTGRYLLASAPLYMLCGTVAFIALGALVATGLAARAAMRQAARSKPSREPAKSTAKPSPPGTAVTHSIIAAALLAVIGAHIVGSGQMDDTLGKILLTSIILVLVLGWSMVLPRWVGMRTRWLPVMLPAITSAILLLILPAPTARSHLMEPAITTPSPIPVRFPHEKHTAVNCLVCHHNLLDNTGSGNCIACHRSSRRDLRHSSEATFHVFCRSCHVLLATQGQRHGPTRACSECHTANGDIF
jgi:hypothetical protein